ncbi:MAG: YegS/Rv2252/BmrU family lipid kinase [Lachnospiraceae bacterium]|nr:YegS/Rv2252/BmrU family lipid kinase [Lachnospiraceae bacterium]
MLYFFVNPASRSGKGAAKWEQTEHILKEKKIPYEVHFLKAATSPRPVMEEIFAKETGPVSLVLIGGDGTLNQCINGIPDFDRVELSVIPTGSGNDFCRNKDIPKTLEEQIEHIVTKKHTLLVDRGIITYRKERLAPVTSAFMVSTGLGYDAAICHMAERSKLKKILNKIKLGKLVYLMIGIKEIFGARLTDMDITIDGSKKHYKNVFFIATMNQPFEGGGVAMTPNASDCDGQLDFMIFSGVSKLKALCTIPLLYVKKHAGKPGVTLLTGKEVSVTTSGARIVHCDGESEEGCTGFEARLDGKVKFIC